MAHDGAMACGTRRVATPRARVRSVTSAPAARNVETASSFSRPTDQLDDPDPEDVNSRPDAQMDAMTDDVMCVDR